MVPNVATALPLSSTRSRVTLLLIKPRKGVYGTWDVTVISVFSPEKNPRGWARGGAGAKSPPTAHAIGVALAVGVDIGEASIVALATAPNSAMAAARIFSVLMISALLMTRQALTLVDSRKNFNERFPPAPGVC